MTLLYLSVIATLISTCTATCYFSAELQGEYVMQTVAAGAQVQYSPVQVTPDAIPMWGLCQRRQGDHVILNDSFNGTECIRCFHLKLHSPNVLQVRTCPTCLQKCYLSEELARRTCPSAVDFANNKYKEIILYRTKEIGGGSIKKMFCPITGRYTFTSNQINETDDDKECYPSVSKLENCPRAGEESHLDVYYQGCLRKFEEPRFECLGDWAGPEDQRYLALLDTKYKASSGLPQYLCALYKENEQRENIMMAFSSDSTCTTDLYSASNGHITWNLTAVVKKWPALQSPNKCRFPIWSQGKWEHLNVQANMLTYKDHISFNTYNMRCAQTLDGNKFIVLSKNDCGDEVYKCIRLNYRSANVLEFQISISSSLHPNNNSLCSELNFPGNVWVTQAKLEGLEVSPCPVTGEYSGFIPNANGLCARLASDQMHPETMYFTVSDCEQHEIYEEREYQCLGQWEEEGVTYTYTQRKDFGTYECFVGSIVSNNEIYIKEAGEHCGRGINPMHSGMKLQSKEVNMQPEPTPPPSEPMTSWYVTSAPTKPWKPITAPPRHSGDIRTVPSTFVALTLAAVLSLLS